MEPERYRPVPRPVTVATLQMASNWDLDGNIARAEALVRRAAAQGAQIILLPQLFETPYFCIEQESRHLALARPAEENRAVRHFSGVAKELGVVLPISFFERAGLVYFNSMAVIDADGSLLGVYRAAHLPNGVGHQDKSYFSAGDTGFEVWNTRYARIGVGSAWDCWFPESARVMALREAEIFFFASALGVVHRPEPLADSRAHWRITQQGHAAANLTPLVASNRCGLEHSCGDPEKLSVRFYGSSFIADQCGAILAEAGNAEAVLTRTFDLEAIARQRAGSFMFQDRRPVLYRTLLSLDGSV